MSFDGNLAYDSTRFGALDTQECNAPRNLIKELPMDWFYTAGMERRGPVDDAAFRALVDTGEVNDETLVWHDGLADWAPYGSLKAPVSVPPPLPQPRAEEEQPAPRPRDTRPAPIALRTRFYAQVFDMFLVGALATSASNYATIFHGYRGGSALSDSVFMPTTRLFLMLLLNAFFVARFGASPGHMLFRIAPLRDGKLVSTGTAAARAAGEFLSGIICFLGYAAAFIDSQKCAMHDRIAKTHMAEDPRRAEAPGLPRFQRAFFMLLIAEAVLFLAFQLERHGILPGIRLPYPVLTLLHWCLLFSGCIALREQIPAATSRALRVCVALPLALSFLVTHVTGMPDFFWAVSATFQRVFFVEVNSMTLIMAILWLVNALRVAAAIYGLKLLQQRFPEQTTPGAAPPSPPAAPAE